MNLKNCSRRNKRVKKSGVKKMFKINFLGVFIGEKNFVGIYKNENLHFFSSAFLQVIVKEGQKKCILLICNGSNGLTVIDLYCSRGEIVFS